MSLQSHPWHRRLSVDTLFVSTRVENGRERLAEIVGMRRIAVVCLDDTFFC